MNISICDECGREIKKDFRFCPWCGEKVNSLYSEDNFVSFIMESKYTERQNQLDNVKKQLDELERELDVLVMSVELAR